MENEAAEDIPDRADEVDDKEEHKGAGSRPQEDDQNSQTLHT